jgi:hypothetical protein
MATLTGSRALKHWFPDAREPNGDWDWLSPYPVNFDARRNDCFWDKRLGQWPWSNIATPDELYTLKISHGFWEINGPQDWDKHAYDIIFLSRKNCTFIRELYDIVLPVWKDHYKKHSTNLNQSSDKFFADAVVRKYVHDSVHDSVAYGERPLYEAILQDGSDVLVDNTKFWSMNFETQVKLVREEIYTTALERILIPQQYRGSPRAAYHWALRRTATSLFKGEWALFLMRNLDLLMKPDCAYVSRHLENKHKLQLTGEVND